LPKRQANGPVPPLLPCWHLAAYSSPSLQALSWLADIAVVIAVAPSCLQAAQHSRFEVGGGPLLRAQSARWLCFGADTGAAAVRHANALCREFALGE
jgi:hypothetical protein